MVIRFDKNLGLTIKTKYVYSLKHISFSYTILKIFFEIRKHVRRWCLSNNIILKVYFRDLDFYIRVHVYLESYQTSMMELYY